MVSDKTGIQHVVQKFVWFLFIKPTSFFVFCKILKIFSFFKAIINLFSYEKGPYFYIKMFITLSHVRKITSFQVYGFCSPVPLLFLFYFRGWRCPGLFSGVLFTSEIRNEIILLCMVFDAGLRLEKMKAERS